MSIINCKDEFLQHTMGKNIVCATLTHSDECDTSYNLPVGYTSEQLQQFLAATDFQYDVGYGSQYLYGTIWYTDGTWSSRGEYDGSECWEHNVRPVIPEELVSNYKLNAPKGAGEIA